MVVFIVDSFYCFVSIVSRSIASIQFDYIHTHTHTHIHLFDKAG